MKTLAYIIKDNVVIAETETELKNGSTVRYAFNVCKEAINADRKYNLVNARIAKISRAKKYQNKTQEYAKEINSAEFLILAD